MKRGLFLGVLILFWLFSGSAWAKQPDPVSWLKGEYVGVGSLDMSKFHQRPLFDKLMSFFETDVHVRHAFDVLKSTGIKPEETVSRVVFGVPTDVEKSEHIIIWETKEDLAKYRSVLSAYPDMLEKRLYLDVDYFATLNNECIAVLGNRIIQGSEQKVRSVIESWKTSYTGGPKREKLKDEINRADKTKDAWFAFALSDEERKRIAKGDPVVDMSKEDQGMLNFGDLQSGSLSLDLSNGLNCIGQFGMISSASASQAANILMYTLQNATQNENVKVLGVESLVTGIAFSAFQNYIRMSVVYDQEKFDQLIVFFTQYAKALPHPASSDQKK